MPPEQRVCAFRGIIFYFATLLLGVPFKKFLTFSTAVSISRWRASWLAHAMCGVIIMLSSPSSGLSARIGSVDTTSDAAAYTLPDSKASRNPLR